MDSLAAQARQLHRDAARRDGEAAALRARRDRIIRRLRSSDPARWTMERLATEVGCSKQLVSRIISGA